MAVSGESKTSLDKIRFMPERDPSALVVAGYRYSILCPINKGFCNFVTFGVEPRCCDWDLRHASNRQLVSIEWRDSDVAASGDTTAEATARSADHSGDQSGGGAVAYVARFGASRGARGGKPADRVPKQPSARQMELIGNGFTEQRLAPKFRSPLRVICATPFQKRSVWHRSERFLYCVCRSVR